MPSSLQNFIVTNPLRYLNSGLGGLGSLGELNLNTLSGLPVPVRALLYADYYNRTQQNMLVLCNGMAQLELLRDNLQSAIEEDVVQVFPGLGLKPYEWKLPHGTVREERMRMYERLYHKERLIVLTTWDAALEKLASTEQLHKNVLQCSVGQKMTIHDLRLQLYKMGFREETMVENIGDFSVRGGIVDIFPLLAEQPVRIDFFGDEIESIRKFDIFSQRSIQDVQHVPVFPMDEIILEDELVVSGLDAIKSQGMDAQSVQQLKVQILERGDLSGIHWQRAFFQTVNTTIFDLQPDVQIFAEDMHLAKDKCVEVWNKLFAGWDTAQKSNTLVNAPNDLFITWKQMDAQLKTHSVRHVWEREVMGVSGVQHVPVQEQKRGQDGLQQVQNYAAELKEQGYQVWLISSNEAQADRLSKMLMESEYEAMSFSGVLVGYLSSGFVLPTEKLALFTDHQIFNRFSRKTRRVRNGGGVAIPDLESLEKGDYVLHEQHGLGKFLGLSRSQTAGGAQVDCILLAYNGEDRLRLPISALHVLEKYHPKEDEEPVLHTLGGKRWSAAKRKAKKAVVKIAQELVQLYAKRKEAGGYAYPCDSQMQAEFEAAFEYEPTPDQVRAITEVKADMQKPMPMDRLVCGDVGFGKTEVAMRAAFKAVSSKKQVIVLVPTTILAAQHYENFLERFASWPVHIDVISRYRTAAEKKQIAKRLQQGTIDIIIGTHALLSPEIQCQNLGLLIIDEEQKFGVKQKERIREIRYAVDTLSMSATPIPRTLHMSLSGARDISLIATPPRNRLPVLTQVMQRDDLVLQEAVVNEIERGGQVFVVHDRVASINTLANEVEQWVPTARVGVAHGQMKEGDLEQVMSAFMHKEFDVLVSTSIIESGLDVSNANTIIIHNAQNFGLSQLYQMRGRVGRSSTLAYAFLVTPAGKLISKNAQKRLEALERYTDLGSGYQLAMRDLEIRGAGNMLGMEQHGHIAEVGYETYLRMIKEAMAEITGQEIKSELQPQLDIAVDAYLPETYILDGMQRIALYQKAVRLTTLQGVQELSDELQDRYGPLPECVHNLVLSAQLSVLCKQLGISTLKLDRMSMQVTYVLDRVPNAKQIAKIMEKTVFPVRFVLTEPLQAVFTFTDSSKNKQMQNACEGLASIC